MKLMSRIILLLIFVAGIFGRDAFAAVLPEDRVDVLYHGYDGGGVSIDGPSILLRKNIADVVSVSGNYYVDMISGASIDVEATASAYEEERKEVSLGVDYLVEKATLSLSGTQSKESDYEAQTVGFGISQDFFGDLSTLSLKASHGSDIVRRNGDDEFEAEAEHRRYGITWTQVLTKSLITSVAVETVSDEGFLNNPYRSVRYRDDFSGKGFSYQAELYPETRNSDAVAVRAMYYLPYRAALKAEYRYYSDSWDIQSNNFELRYTHPWRENWLFEAKWRSYGQTGASFYQDVFDYANQTNYRARDKELSEHTNNTLGLGVTYYLPSAWSFLPEKSSLNLYWDRMMFDYEDFRDVRVHDVEDGPDYEVGAEPLYNFDANVIRFYFSAWF